MRRKLFASFNAILAAHNPSLKVEMVVGRGDVRDEIVDYAASAKTIWWSLVLVDWVP